MVFFLKCHLIKGAKVKMSHVINNNFSFDYQNSLNQETIESVTAITGCDQHLQFASSMIQQVDISESVRVNLQDKIQEIQQRLKDTNLYLAVIGEFSSGKSTFINALLKDNLLKTSVLVATASATRLQHGKSLRVKVSFSGNKPGTLRTKPDAKLIKIPWFPQVNGISIRQFVHVVTSDEEVSKDVQALTIEHPASFLANGTVIIDTPGTNAVQLRHGAITQKIVEQEADAAIIIIPASQGLSKTLIDFLSGAIHPFLHRCIFIVTKMDEICQEEQQEVIEVIKIKLQAELGISQATILAAVPQVIIDELQEEKIPEKLLHWKDKFQELEIALQERLYKERTISIAESIIRLLTLLLEQLEYHLQIQWSQYEIRQKAIEQEIIPDLEAFTSEQQVILYKKIEEATSKTIKKCDDCIEKHEGKILEKVRNAIFNAEDLSELNNVVEIKSESILKDNQSSLEKTLQKKFEGLEVAAQNAGNYFDNKFAEVYRKLKKLAGSLEAKANFEGDDLQKNTSQVFSSTQSLLTEMNDQDNRYAGRGVAIGFVLGNIIFPGFGGMVVGSLVGLITSAFFTPSLDERKQDLWEKLRPSIQSYFETVKNETQQAIQKQARCLTAGLDLRLENYINQYQEIVNQILIEQKTELARLNQLQISTQDYLSEIEQRQRALSDQQKRLAQVTV
jgi:GTPase Era involved in 16S rRNA processing/gas vesicle protein